MRLSKLTNQRWKIWNFSLVKASKYTRQKLGSYIGLLCSVVCVVLFYSVSRVPKKMNIQFELSNKMKLCCKYSVFPWTIFDQDLDKIEFTILTSHSADTWNSLFVKLIEFRIVYWEMLPQAIFYAFFAEKNSSRRKFSRSHDK